MYLRDKLATKLQRIISWSSIKTFKRIVSRNILTKCPVNISYISAAEEIFIRNEGSLRVKVVRTKPQEVKSMHVNLTMEIIKNNSRLFYLLTTCL